jgi:hypothetical protein
MDGGGFTFSQRGLVGVAVGDGQTQLPVDPGLIDRLGGVENPEHPPKAATVAAISALLIRLVLR